MPVASAKSLVGRLRFDRSASFRVSSIESWGEEAMRHFYFKAMIKKSAGEHADWKAVDAAILQAAAMAKEVARTGINDWRRYVAPARSRAVRPKARSMSCWSESRWS
jgi:hypothetical protein